MVRTIFLFLFSLMSLSVSAVEPWFHATIEEEFDIVKEYVETAITNQGLVVAHHSNVGEMLERTGKDLGETHQPYLHAEVVEFCSAELSRKMIEANPANIIFCPYSIALYVTPEKPKTVHLAYLRLSALAADEPSKTALSQVEKMLQQIIQESIE